jgi:transketolase
MVISSKDLATNIRVNSLNMVARAKASHIGSALSIADLIAVLYSLIMRGDPNDPLSQTRDRFILSKGHACVAVYSALADMGYFPHAELETYGANYSNLMNHISHKVPGVEFSTGSLGHGLPFAVGKALFAKRSKSNWNVYVILSDGELNEGSNWESLMFASHHCLDNLTIIIDCNGLQSLTTTKETLDMGSLLDKFHAFGSQVFDIDGHNHEQIYQSLSSPSYAKPKVVIARTVKGKGVSFMENKVMWHYNAPNHDQLMAALKEVGSSNA